MGGTRKSRQSSADLWKKCAPSSLRWAPADSSSAHQKTEKNTGSPPLTAEWTQTWQCGAGLGHWSCQEDRTTHGQARKQTESGGRQTGEVRREEGRVIEANPESFDPQVVSHPPRLPLTICSPGSHLSVSGKATSACSIAIASSQQQ